jgi:hypothetical protein
MAKDLDMPPTIENDLEKLSEGTGEKSSLPAYFLRCDEKNREALYIPGCLVVIEAMAAEDDYFNCDRPEVLMTRGEFGIGGKMYIEGFGYRVCNGLTLSPRIKDFFKDKEFDYGNTSVATKLFLNVREKIQNS